jgi:hypothetical protein
MDEVKMFMFARWLAMCYEGVLNKENGYWYKEQLEHFNKVIWPQYLENGSVEETLKFLFEDRNTEKWPIILF